MSQKELLYIEDAINHERALQSICIESTSFLEDASLADFLLKEIKKHESMEKKLMKELEGAINEW